ncbi:MAG TPA: RHS repeat-associated core domain-containing protein [Treponemataceae bacterium]|nr:RHS repeat-associated core domain-containing protein [Treponemataceae bacterium]
MLQGTFFLTWTLEKTSNIGSEFLPYKFTGKELDPETGLYYYGARYLDPKYSIWLSADPALGEYIPGAPVNEEAKKRNSNLPGMGGVFNTVNLHLYHYAGNNPVKYVDPDGKEVLDANSSIFMSSSSAKLGTGEEYIANVGCVLTAYTRIASAIAGSPFTLDDANDLAIEKGLFTDKNLLTPAAGASLINALLESAGITDKSVEFRGSIIPLSGNDIDLIAAISLTENFNDGYFITGRLETTDKTGTVTYDHTVNINHGAVFGDIESEKLMNLKINDTSGVRKHLYNDSRANTLLRFDLFKLIITEGVNNEN